MSRIYKKSPARNILLQAVKSCTGMEYPSTLVD